MSEDPKAGATPAGGDGSAASSPAPSAEDVRAQVLAEISAELKAATGHESIAALKAATAKADADRLAAQGEFQKLAESAVAERDSYRARYEQALIRNAILAASVAAVDPEDVAMHLGGSARVGQDGSVSVGGKAVTAAVEDLLKRKPHLAKPAGGQGSGSGSGGTGARTPDKLSMAELEALRGTDPAAYRSEIARRARGGNA